MNTKTRGFIALTSVLTLSVIALMVVIHGSQIGLSALIRATEDTAAARACALAEGCAESALYTFVSDIDAPSAEELTLGDTACAIREVRVMETGTYSVVTEGTDRDITCEIRMDVDTRESSIIIDYWQTEYIHTL